MLKELLRKYFDVYVISLIDEDKYFKFSRKSKMLFILVDDARQATNFIPLFGYAKNIFLWMLNLTFLAQKKKLKFKIKRMCLPAMEKEPAKTFFDELLLKIVIKLEEKRKYYEKLIEELEENESYHMVEKEINDK